jgi:tRNA pseudouridine55 synthase
VKPIAFLVDKPEGMGSTDVVRQFKRNLPKPFKKIGHFGTLDPFATGLLIIGVNGSQRLSDYVHADYKKVYRAVGLFGVHSDTGDKTGSLEQKHSDAEIQKSFEEFDKEELEKKWFEQFSHEYFQRPPAFSAAKHKGKNLYEYAREGVIIEKEKVRREVLDFKILKWDLPRIEFEVTVGIGTYIRVLFEDMAKAVGSVGHLEQLRRVSIGPHLVEKACDLELWPKDSLSPEELYLGQEIVLNNPDNEKKYRNGMKLRATDCASHLSDNEHGWVKSPSGELLGLARRVGNDLLVLFNFPQNS